MTRNELKKKITGRQAYQALGVDLPESAVGDKWVRIRCLHPDHADKHPACDVNMQHGGIHCKACAFKGDYVDVAVVTRGYSEREAIAWFVKECGLTEMETTDGPSPVPDDPSVPDCAEGSMEKAAERDAMSWDKLWPRLQRAQEKLRTASKADEILRHNLGITKETAQKFGVGFYKGQEGDAFRDPRLIFPVMGEDGKPVSIRCYKRKARAKVMPLQAGMPTSLFPLDHVPKGTTDIVIVEGEKDCMVAHQHGLMAVTGTGGAGTWPRRWSEQLAELGIKCAIIVYDQDPAGHQGARKVAASLARVGIEGRIASWPDDVPVGFDVADWFKSGKPLDQLRETVLGKAMPYTPRVTRLSDHVVLNDGVMIMTTSDTAPQRELTAELAETLIRCGTFFMRGDEIWYVDSEKPFPICSKHELAGALDGEVEFGYGTPSETAVEEDGSPVIEYTYTRPPHELFLRMSHSPPQRGRLPVVTHFSRVPVFDKHYQLIPRGYHAESGVYYAGPEIEPAGTTELLDDMCEEFAWRDAVNGSDQANFLGMLLTGLLVTRFIGRHPSVVINGNQPGLGKSYLVELVSWLIDGQSPQGVTYTRNDEELEKQLATLVDQARNVILIDNIRTERVVTSAVLERSVTAPMLNFRRLGGNTAITMPNTVLFFLTVNNGALSRDLVTRCIPIYLYYEGPADKRVFQRVNLDEWVMDHRWDILAELVGMVARWVEAGRPAGKCPTMRFGEWSRTIGGILEVNGYGGFLANWDEVASELTAEDDEIVKLAIEVVRSGRGDTDLTARELVGIAKAAELLPDIVDKSVGRAALSLGHYLARFKDARLRLDEDVTATLRIKWSRSGSKNVYCFEVDGELPPEPKIDTWRPDASDPDDEEGLSASKIEL